MKLWLAFLALWMCADRLFAQELSYQRFEEVRAMFSELGGNYHGQYREQDRSSSIIYLYSLPKDASEEVLKRIPDLPFDFGLIISNSSDRVIELNKLAHLRNLAYLHLTGGDVSFEGVDTSLQLQRLVYLTLAEIDVNDAELQFVGNLKTLKTLRLFWNTGKFTDIGLKEISRLENLTELGFYYFDQVNDEVLESVGKLSKLTSFELNASSNATNQGLDHLSKLKNLNNLLLTCSDMTFEGVESIENLKQLQRLHLPSSGVNDAGLREIAKLKSLTNLDITSSKITDVGLREMVQMQQLTALSLYSEAVTDVGLKEIAKLQSLNKLSLSCQQVSDEGLRELVTLKKLRTLTIPSDRITDEGISKFQDSLPKCEFYRR